MIARLCLDLSALFFCFFCPLFCCFIFLSAHALATVLLFLSSFACLNLPYLSFLSASPLNVFLSGCSSTFLHLISPLMPFYQFTQSLSRSFQFAMVYRLFQLNFWLLLCRHRLQPRLIDLYLLAWFYSAFRSMFNAPHARR